MANSFFSRLRPYIIPIGAVAALVVVLIGIKFSQISMLIAAGKEAEKAGPPPEVVGSSQAKRQTWNASISAIGTVAAGKGVTLSNDAAGVVKALHFESGKKVKQGSVLLELDTSVERAQLDSAMARGDLAETNRDRARVLAAQDAVPEAELDSEETTVKTTLAEASALRAQISRKVLRAPFSGQLGIRLVNVGQYLNPGTPVVVLQSSENQYVDFTLPQEHLRTVHVGLPVRLHLDGNDRPAMDGSIVAIDPAVDEATRSVKVRATANDPDSLLRPGMFVTVKVLMPKERKIVTVPVTALVHASYGDSVFVIEESKSKSGKIQKIARQQFVRVGETQGDFVAIEKGLEGDEEVVSLGAFKLRNGATVNVNNDVKLDAKLHPTPSNS
ncbi:MAG: efflux RND transporter periplasmic adaptor subunit [Myxococcales bacterium]|nr:MAG: efflux RND transporter periplasmic adaptor subunit [Myxococcales bacterium]